MNEWAFQPIWVVPQELSASVPLWDGGCFFISADKLKISKGEIR
jgi:hypothetical protein